MKKRKKPTTTNKSKYVGKAYTPERMRKENAEFEDKMKNIEGGEQFLKFFKAMISPNDPDNKS